MKIVSKASWLFFLTAVACRTSSPEATDRNRDAASLSLAPSETRDAALACLPIAKEKCQLAAYDTSLWDAPLPTIVDAEETMAPFYEHLATLIRGNATDHVRVGVYGDSNMTMDFITGALRRLIQAKFGDAGHGYVALARPWGWYHHEDVHHDMNVRAWHQMATSTDPIEDGHYGFANIAAETKEAGAWASVATADSDSPIGTKVSSVDIYYLKQPSGGTFALKIDGQRDRDVPTQNPTFEAGFEHLDLPDGPHKIECVVKPWTGLVRLFGASLERGTPGIVIDSLGTGALNYEQLDRVKDSTRIPQLAHRKYDLVVFLLGTNLFAPAFHEKWMAHVFESFRTAIPNLPILIMSPPDIELSQKSKESDPRIIRVSEQLKEIAARRGCGFWDFRAAMGGDMSMMRFAKLGLAEWDLVHFKKAGGAMMGERIGHALFAGFDAYVAKHPEAGCRPR